MEKSEWSLKFARRKAALDMWLHMIDATIYLDTAKDLQLYCTVTDCRYHLSGHYAPEQTGQNNFEVCDGKISTFFVMLSRPEATSMLFFLGSHNYVHYSIAQKKKLA